MGTSNDEKELRDKIKLAVDGGDIATAQQYLTELIALQDLIPTPQLSNEDLAKHGVDLLLLERERSLRDQIKEANQQGDYVEALSLTKQLLQTQRLQPRYTGIKLRE